MSGANTNACKENIHGEIKKKKKRRVEATEMDALRRSSRI
jgi:hypothetical protein